MCYLFWSHRQARNHMGNVDEWVSLQLSFTRVDSNRQLPTVNRLFSLYLSLSLYLRHPSIHEVVIFHSNALVSLKKFNKSTKQTPRGLCSFFDQISNYFHPFFIYLFFKHFQLRLLRRMSVVRVTATKHWMLLLRPLCFHRIMRKFYVDLCIWHSNRFDRTFDHLSSCIRLSLSCPTGKLEARRRNRSLAVTTGRKPLPYGLVVAAAAATAVVVKKDALAASIATMNPDLTAGSCRRTLRAAGYFFFFFYLLLFVSNSFAYFSAPLSIGREWRVFFFFFPPHSDLNIEIRPCSPLAGEAGRRSDAP